ncbi:hypothetical protein M0R45_036463 [Rubus argutus]|uniref:Uncharacterized protein n=1 Tax=Rubus argutus TaxID=59490 RepID=A0AAW1W0I1_RUBAR
MAKLFDALGDHGLNANGLGLVAAICRLWSFVAGGDNAGHEGIEQLRLRDTGEEARGALGAERRSRGGMGTAMVWIWL